MPARTRLLKTFVVMAFAVFVAAKSAEASSIALQLSDGSTTKTIIDNGVGDNDSTVGVISFSGAIGAWNINNTMGIGEAWLRPGSMDLISGNVSTFGTMSTLNIWFTMYDIATVYDGFNLEFGGSTTNARVTYSAYASGSSLPFASLGPYAGAFSGATGSLVSVSPLYALTQRFTIQGLGGTPVSFSGNAELNSTPEPGSMILLGTGLFGIGILARRRFQARRSVN